MKEIISSVITILLDSDLHRADIEIQGTIATRVNYLTTSNTERLNLINGDPDIFGDILNLMSQYESMSLEKSTRWLILTRRHRRNRKKREFGSELGSQTSWSTTAQGNRQIL